jgi:hypothetical protein
MLRKLKLKHGYHDALVQSVQFQEDDDVLIAVDLCGCCNPTPGGHATLTFCGVRNFDQVHLALEAARQENQGKGYIDEIVNIFRDDQTRGYLVVFTTAGDLTFDAKGVVES